MKTVVCFGEALIDFLGAPPLPDQPRAFLQHAGGAPANVAVAVAQLGGRAEFAGMLGADLFGDFLHDSFAGFGVGTTHTRRTAAAPTALAFVALDAQGERSFSFYRPPAADLLFADSDFDPCLFTPEAFLHVCSNSLTEASIAATTLSALHRARAAGMLVSVDMNLRPALWPREVDPAVRIRAMLALADIVKLSREELIFLAGAAGGIENVLAGLWRGTSQLLIVTDGAAPLQWFTRSARGSRATRAAPVRDTTAAGDAFVGGLLHCLARDDLDPAQLPALLADHPRLEAMLDFAAACGAIAVSRPGAFAAMPTRAEVEHLLAYPHPTHEIQA